VSDVIEGIGSRNAVFPFRLLLSFVGDLPGDWRVWPLLGFGVRTLDGELPDSLERAESWLIGGWLWNRQNMW
jgi:hypothetical protein